MNGLLSRATVTAVGLLCKTFLNIGYCSSVNVNGIENLYEALESNERNNGRGVITVANHISTLDDPVVWGVLPFRFYLDSRMMRWTLGASDVMFTNPKGQIIETFRGRGIYQPAVDTAIEKLNQGDWIHLFCEGKVNQPAFNPHEDPTRLLRFKWGVGRILMESNKPPVIIPMWLTGFDQLMPERRQAPWKFFPRPRAALTITFGEPISIDELRERLEGIVRERKEPAAPKTTRGGMIAPERPRDERTSALTAASRWLGGAVAPEKNGQSGQCNPALYTVDQVASIRSAVTALVQEKVEELGREVTKRQRSKC
ncbi:uncharacterized protein FIBRA_02228 [Fibroporia radiculosa]|uniref:Tafazzin family protein n=1 Tax=Fibroporia radiculosa TaxID=599839 RepID=J4GMN7_9APHY|nr:uncharacterized protein FIBRA_02228 [Fibroporia radiculosa]CCM00200.1 predicted protein [Fibroporia radiculosa]